MGSPGKRPSEGVCLGRGAETPGRGKGAVVSRAFQPRGIQSRERFMQTRGTAGPEAGRGRHPGWAQLLPGSLLLSPCAPPQAGVCPGLPRNLGESGLVAFG